MEKLILHKETAVKESVKKSIFIKMDVHKKIKELSEETGVPMAEIVDAFLRYGISNVVIKDEGEK